MVEAKKSTRTSATKSGAKASTSLSQQNPRIITEEKDLE